MLLEERFKNVIGDLAMQIVIKDHQIDELKQEIESLKNENKSERQTVN